MILSTSSGFKNRSWLVEEDDRLVPGALLDGQDLGELYDLPIGKGQGLRCSIRGNFGPEFVELNGGEPIQVAPVIETEAHGLALVAEEDVLGDADIRQQRLFLKYEADASVGGGCHAAERRLASAQ